MKRFSPRPQPSLSVLYMLSDGATHEAVHLLCRMLVFDPVTLIFLLTLLVGGGAVVVFDVCVVDLLR